MIFILDISDKDFEIDLGEGYDHVKVRFSGVRTKSDNLNIGRFLSCKFKNGNLMVDYSLWSIDENMAVINDSF